MWYPAGPDMHVIGISLPTLHAHYRAEIDRCAAKVQAELIESLMKLTRGTGPTALKAIQFCLQCRFGWSRYAQVMTNYLHILNGQRLNTWGLVHSIESAVAK
jgi:hypothetical protein